MVGIILLAADRFLDKDDEKTRDALDIAMFLGIYGLLFWISAFGIVWYGVFIYLLMIVMIGYGILGFERYLDEKEKKEYGEQGMIIPAALSIFTLGILVFYFL